MAAKKQYSAPALEKGLDIIELLANEADGLSVTQITEKLNKSVGELFRMLMVLEQRGYVEMIGSSDKYKLSLKLFGLANRHPPTKRLTSVAAPALKKLSNNIAQSCHLVTYYEGTGHVIVQQDSPTSRYFGVKLGATAPLMNTCSGHVLLSFASDDQYQLMLNSIPEHHPKPEPLQFENMASQIKQRGFESMPSRQAQGVFDIGYPIYDHSGDVLAALVVPFLEYLDASNPIKLDAALPFISEAAKSISFQLGYNED